MKIGTLDGWIVSEQTEKQRSGQMCVCTNTHPNLRPQGAGRWEEPALIGHLTVACLVETLLLQTPMLTVLLAVLMFSLNTN